MASSDESECIRVALRIRPQMPREISEGASTCITIPDKSTPQVLLDNDKAFTYDYAFDVDSTQNQIYDTCVRKLINGCFDGFNATVLAYGQTGSGKTFTMGTGFETQTIDFLEEDATVGVVPRALKHIFTKSEEQKPSPPADSSAENPPPSNPEKHPEIIDFSLQISFMELYNQQLKDLLLPSQAATANSNLKIVEDKNGDMIIPNLTTLEVKNYTDTMNILRSGALKRTTHATNMNATSSRSHAIFTLYLSCTKKILVQPAENASSQNGEASNETSTQSEPQYDEQLIKAKFHFVDLAGSERIKKTGATGDRQKEGININYGLLILGNVVSALGDPTRKGSHVPYRDSKLTRILQDSLGGNSRTLMVACISPSDSEFVESLSTLKYADRARNIKNKVVQNQDSGSKKIAQLKNRIKELENELDDWRFGKRMLDPNDPTSSNLNEYYEEAKMLKADNDSLRIKISNMKKQMDEQKSRLVVQQMHRDMNETLNNSGDTITLGPATPRSTGDDISTTNEAGDAENKSYEKIIISYLQQIEDLRTKLVESEAESERLNKMVVSGITVGGNNLSRPNTAQSMHDRREVHDLVAKTKLEIKEKREMITKSPIRTPIKTGKAGNKIDAIIEISDGDEADALEVNQHDPIEEIEDDSVKLNFVDLPNDSDQEDLDSEAEELELEKSNMHLSLMSSEIDRKEELVEALEKQLAESDAMKQDYEATIEQLRLQIIEKENTKNKVLENLKKKFSLQSNKNTDNSSEIKSIKQKYEKQINEIKKKMASLAKSAKQHELEKKKAVQMKGNIDKFKSEILNMKKQRATFIKQQQQREKLNQKQHLELRKKMQSSESQFRKLDAKSRKDNLDKDRKIQAMKQSIESKNAEIKRLKQVNQPVLKDNKNNLFNLKRTKTEVSKSRARVEKFKQEFDLFVHNKEQMIRMQEKLEKLMVERKSLLRQKQQKSFELNETISLEQDDMNCG